MTEPKYGYLVVVSRSGVDGKAFPIHNNRVLIGRKETCDIRMQIPQVSKEHCVIRVVNDKVVLTNLSENCTSINADTLEAGQQRALTKGDVITIVGRSLRYEKSLTTSRVTSAASTVGANPQPQVQNQTQQRAVVLRTPQSAIPSRMIDRPLIRRELIGGAQSVGRASSRMPRDPETVKKFRLWDQHYSVKAKSETDGMESMNSNGSVSDILDESPPPGLLLDSSADSSMVGINGTKPENDNPFDGPESDVSTFRSMEDSVRNWNPGADRQNTLQQRQQNDRRLSAESNDVQDTNGDDGLQEQVAQIMEDINQMAHGSRAHTPLTSRARRNKTSNMRESTLLSPTSTRVSGRQNQSGRTDRRRSRSLPRGLESAPTLRSSSNSCDRVTSSSAIPSVPLTRGVDSYGSEEETARTTVGVSPTSQYSRSPTLELQRRMEQTRLTPVKRTAPPLYYGSLPRSLKLSNSARAASANTSHTTQSPAIRTPTRKIKRSGTAMSSLDADSSRKIGAGMTTKGLQLTSPLKRTLSCSGQSSMPSRSREMVIRTVRPLMKATTNGSTPAHSVKGDGGESSDEIPTEPEPSSDSDLEDSNRKQSPLQQIIPSQTPPVHPSIAATVTPHRRQVLLKDVSSTARKSVRFGPPLSPELFDAQAPPSTPIRRGTPMQIARMSSILRQQSESVLQSATPLPFHRSRRTGRIGKQPATVAVPRNRRLFRNHSSNNSSDENSAAVVDPSLLQSLLQPKRTRRHEMMEYLARLEGSNWTLNSTAEKPKQLPQQLEAEDKRENQLQRSTVDRPTGTGAEGTADRRLSQTGLLMDEIFDMEGASADIDDHQMSYSPLPVPVVGSSECSIPKTPSNSLPSMSPMTRALVSAAEQSAASHTLLETITPKRLGRAIEVSEPSTEEESAILEQEIIGIESPSTIGSPIDRQRKNQRRRSLRVGDSVRRTSLESPVLLASNDMSPSLVVQTRHRRLSNGIVPPPTPLFNETLPLGQHQGQDSGEKTKTLSASIDRKERRRTAPDLGDNSSNDVVASSTSSMGEIGASIAAMATALGEDLPVMFGGKTKPAAKKQAADESTEKQSKDDEEQNGQGEWEPVPLSPSLALSTEQPLGLAEAMRMLESDSPLLDSEDNVNSSAISDFQESSLALSSADDETENADDANGAHRRRTIAGSEIPDHNTGNGTRSHVARRSLGASASASEQLLREQSELQSRLSANTSADSSMHSATASPTLSLGKRMRENSSLLRQQRRQTIALENIACAENVQERGKLLQDLDERNEEGLEDDTADLLARRQRLRRLQERRRRRQTMAELKRRRSSWRGWMPSASASPQVSGGDGGSQLQLLLSSPPQSPLLSAATLDTAADHVPNLPMGARDSSQQPHVLPQPFANDADKSSDIAVAAVSSPPTLSLELQPQQQQKQNISHITDAIVTTTPPASAMYPPPAWNLSAASTPNDAFSRSLPRTSDSDGRTLPKRRRITDYVTNALGLAKDNSGGSSASRPYGDVELATATTSKTRNKETTKVEQPQYAYPPRPMAIDAEWEHVDASDIPTNAQSNIGNSATLDKSHLDEKESIGVAATRLDGDESTSMYDGNLSDVVVEPSQQQHQAVELFAVSHQTDEAATSSLLLPSADTQEETEKHANASVGAADSESDLPEREPDIGVDADRELAVNEQGDKTLINVHRQSAANSATLLSPPRTRARATRNTKLSKNEVAADDLLHCSAATNSRNPKPKHPPVSRELTGLPPSKDVVPDSIVVGGHALRKQSDECDEQSNVKVALPPKQPARRGRPPKKSQLKEAAKEVAKEEIASPMRTRGGRKRKVDNTEQLSHVPTEVSTTVAPVKRGRGRPPKTAKAPTATTGVEAATKVAAKPTKRTTTRRGAKAAANSLPISPPKTRSSKRTKR
ncbi:hypothetical protein H4R24_003376 [Coemansia sp. RSA 988]|nr:hypothetical protein H4R24_003376 [Coemansia sp. RSA 988]